MLPWIQYIEQGTICLIEMNITANRFRGVDWFPVGNWQLLKKWPDDPMACDSLLLCSQEPVTDHFYEQMDQVHIHPVS